MAAKFRGYLAAVTAALTLALGTLFVPVLATPAAAADSPRTINYLGVLIEFPGLEVEMDSPEVLQVVNQVTKTGGKVITGTRTVGVIGGTKTENIYKPITSLEQYINKYSYGTIALNVDFFPKNTAGTAPVAYQAPQARGYYMPKSATNPAGYTSVGEGDTRLKGLLSGAVAAIKSQVEAVYTPVQLDSDGDGRLDAINFFAAGGWNYTVALPGGKQTDKRGDALWSHRAYDYLGTLGGKQITDYTLDNAQDPASAGSMFHYTYAKNADGTDAYNADGTRKVEPNRAAYTVILHEYMHILGLKDLYRGNANGETSSGYPVDFYSLMASQDQFVPQAPLAWESANVLQWSDPIPELAAGQEQEICKPAYVDLAERRALVIKSAIKPAEYFVVDYYAKPADAIKAGASDGVIVYRVQDQKLNNLEGSVDNPAGDAVFIYRPGETANGQANASGTNLADAVRTAGTTIGKSLNEASGWDADALYFTDGSNSGIKIQVAAGSSADCLKISYTAPTVQGSGTQADPYLIHNAAEWSNFVQPGKYAKVVNDIDFASASVPAISGSDIHLDGDGHKLSNLVTTGGGLFGDLTNADIKNLKIENITAQGAVNNHVGAFANSLNGGTVSNVQVLSGSVQAGAPSKYGYDGAGGFVGNMAGGTITNSSTAANVSGGKNAGGFVGLAQAGAIRDSSASGAVAAASAQKSGGFVGATMDQLWAGSGSTTFKNDLYLVSDDALGKASSGGDLTGVIGVKVAPDSLTIDAGDSAAFTVSYCMNDNGCAATSSVAALAVTVKSTAVATANGVNITGVAAGSTDAELAFTWGSARLAVTRPVTVNGTAVDPSIPTSPQPDDDVKVTFGAISDSTAADAKDCAAGTVAQVQERTTTTTPYKWDATAQKWVLDTANAAPKTDTVAADPRQMTDAELHTCAGDAPADQVEQTDWQDGQDDMDWDYDARKVTQYRTVTTTPYKWDSAQHKYVLNTALAASVQETQQRDMTAEEIKAGTPKPNAEVSYSDWKDVASEDAKNCEAGTVAQERTKTVVEYIWDAVAADWVKDSNNPSVSTEQQTRQMTGAEKAACPAKPVDPAVIGESTGTPTAPKWVVPDASDPASCTVQPYVTIPDSDNFTYTINGEAAAAGDHKYDYGASVKVVAAPKQGVKLADGAQTSWEFSAALPTNCGSESSEGEAGEGEGGNEGSGEGENPEVVDPGSSDSEVTQPEAKPGQQSVQVGTEQARQMPPTGANGRPLLIAGGIAVLAIAGGVALSVYRKNHLDDE